MDPLVEVALSLMELTRQRREALPADKNLKHNRIALISGLADAFCAAGIPAAAVSVETKIGPAKISNMVVLQVGDPSEYMDIEGRLGWDDILAGALSHTKLAIADQTPAQMSMKVYTSEQCRQSLWPDESKRLDTWQAEDAIFIAARLIDLSTTPRTEKTPRPRL